MIFCRHTPAEPLARYVDWFWFYEDLFPAHRREHVLPDGRFELIIDLRDEPRRLFDREKEGSATIFRHGWLSGAHSKYIIIDALPGSSMIGVHFKPGGAAAIVGLPADELRDQVVELEGIWSTRAAELREQLLDARGARAKFQVLERFLLGELAGRASDARQQRRVFWALEQFAARAEVTSIRAVVDQLGVSHKQFIADFRRHVGLTPKLFCRIQRFQQVLAELQSGGRVEWADVACTCGYFDQAHFVHDFQAFSGLNPSTYRTADVEHANFVPVEESG